MKPPAWQWLLSRHRRTSVDRTREIYDLEPSDSPSTIDIKSRCNIARILVRAGRSTGRLADGRRLMIVGSGPAGIAAALEAARYGIASYVVERNRTIAHPFAKCRCRYVHPNIYQWPQAIAEKNDTGDGGDQFSLYWEASPVAEACRSWRMRWAGIRHARGQVGFTKFFSGIEVTFATMEDIFKKISPDLEGTEIGMILFCGGFAESCECVGQPATATFWENDNLGAPFFGGAARKQIVCISGGGDGSIQDFLRCSSNRNILDLKNWWKTHSHSPTKAQWDALEAACLDELREGGFYRNRRLRKRGMEVPAGPSIDLFAALRKNLESCFAVQSGDLRDFGTFALGRTNEVRSCMLLTRGARIDRVYPLNIIFLHMFIGAAQRDQLSVRFNHSTLRVIPLPDRRKRILFAKRKKPIVTDLLVVRHGVKPHRMP
jgi:hypothetical protein